jgi:hypothetical protein
MAMNEKFPRRTRPKANPAPISIQAEIVDDYEGAPAESVTLAREAAEAVTLAPEATDSVTLAPEAAEPVAVAQVTAEHATVEPVEVTAVAVSVAAQTGESPSLKFPGASNPEEEFDVSAWQLKTLDLISENVAALFDFTAALGQANSLSDAIELNSRFASERFSALLRQTNEIIELTRLLTFKVSAPVPLRVFPFVA